MATRRRGEELEATILSAAWDELTENGWAKLTIEGVAARAATGKQVIYRRWASRGLLAIAAMRHHFGPMITAVPDTGSLRDDLLDVMRRMAARGRQYPPDMLHGLLAEMPGLEGEFFSTLPGVVAAILRQAAVRGEITDAVLPDRVVSLPIDLVRYQGLRAPIRWTDVSDADLDKAFAEILDDVVLPLVMTYAGPRPPRPQA